MEIPNDVAFNIIKVLNSPRLSLAFGELRKSEVINIPIPTNINEDVVNVLDVVMEEAEELVVAAKAIKKIIRNKKSESDFSYIAVKEALNVDSVEVALRYIGIKKDMSVKIMSGTRLLT